MPTAISHKSTNEENKTPNSKFNPETMKFNKAISTALFMMATSATAANTSALRGASNTSRKLESSFDGDEYWRKFHNYACRNGDGEPGTEGDEYRRFDHYDFYQCKDECYKDDDCKAFEYKHLDSSDSSDDDYHCEHWYEFPKYFQPKHNFKCWLKHYDDSSSSSESKSSSSDSNDFRFHHKSSSSDSKSSSSDSSKDH